MTGSRRLPMRFAPCRAGWKHGGRAGRRTCRSTGTAAPTRSIPPAGRGAREGEALRDETEAMLGAGSPHRRHMDAMPGAREAVAAALAEIDGAVFEDRYGRFAWLARHVAGKARETETEPCYVSRFRETVAHAATLHGEDALTEDGRKAVASWLDYDRTCERLRREIRDWPARADTLAGEWTGPEKDLGAMRRWRERAEPLLADARAMLAEGSPHAPHLAAMPEERGKLVGTAGRLGDALAEIETAELGTPCGDRRRGRRTNRRHRVRYGGIRPTDGARACARRPPRPAGRSARGHPGPSPTA